MNMEQKPKPSYLQARDPTFYNGKRSNLPKCNLALQEESTIDEESLLCEPSEEQSLRNIQIYLRLKNVKSLEKFYELDGNKLHCLVPEGTHNSRSVGNSQCIKRSYTFSHIFGPSSSQEELFNHIIKPKLLDLMNGQNSTLMTYGASGAGKTYTIVGTAEHPGIIPRALEYLFGSLPQLSECPMVKPTVTGEVTFLTEDLKETERAARNTLLSTLNAAPDRQNITIYQQMQERLSSEPVAELEQYKDVSIAVWVSFAEIYNEQIYDLLAPVQMKGKPANRTKLQLGTANNLTYIKKLTNISVRNGIEAYQILQYGLKNLNYASTAVNSHSSRSHCIFTIKLVQIIENQSQDNYRVSYFNFCDLAGSERSKKTLNVGDRLRESNNINTSLMVLGRCINLIRESQSKNNTNKIIPYRESKLTLLFQNALSGKEEVAMIVNINPSAEMFDETTHALNFSAVAKQITFTKVKEEEFVQSNNINESNYLERLNILEEENAKLRDIIIELYNEKEDSKISIEQTTQQQLLDTREYIQQVRDNCEKRMKIMEEQLLKQNEVAMERLRKEYEDKSRAERFNLDVINLDSDSDEDDENSDVVDRRMQELKDSYENKLKIMEEQLREKEAELEKLREECESRRPRKRSKFGVTNVESESDEENSEHDEDASY